MKNKKHKTELTPERKEIRSRRAFFLVLKPEKYPANIEISNETYYLHGNRQLVKLVDEKFEKLFDLLSEEQQEKYNELIK